MIFIGVGTNLGDRWAAFSQAFVELERSGMVRVVESSPVYETAPWGVTDQPPYLNAVWRLETALSPLELLRHLQAVETALGRPAAWRMRWGPREIDLDLLAYGERVCTTPELVVPHPWIPHRPFVLGPWKDLAPYFYLPVWQATVADLWARWASSSWGQLVPPPPHLPLPPIRSLKTQPLGQPT